MVIEKEMAASVGYVVLKMDWVLKMDPEETKYLKEREGHVKIWSSWLAKENFGLEPPMNLLCICHSYQSVKVTNTARETIFKTSSLHPLTHFH